MIRHATFEPVIDSVCRPDAFGGFFAAARPDAAKEP